MRTIVLVVLVAAFAIGPVDVWAAQKSVPSEVEIKALKSMAANISPGTRVKLQTISGRGITGTLMSVSDDAVLVKRRTRLPEPAITIPFVELSRLEIDKQNGMSIGKVIGIGLSAGAGAILTLIAIFATIDD